MIAPPICRRNDDTHQELKLIIGDDVPSEPTKTAAPKRTSQRAERAIGQSERSERSNQTL
jgi:hypothetical protein